MKKKKETREALFYKHTRKIQEAHKTYIIVQYEKDTSNTLKYITS